MVTSDMLAYAGVSLPPLLLRILVHPAIITKETLMSLRALSYKDLVAYNILLDGAESK